MHLRLVFEKNFEINVSAENRVGSHSLQEYFVHGNGLLKCRQILPETYGR